MTETWKWEEGPKITPFKSTIQLVKIEDRRLTILEVSPQGHFTRFPAEEVVDVVQFDYGAPMVLGWLVRRDNGVFMFVEEFEADWAAAKWSYFGQALKNEDQPDDHQG